MTAATAAEGNKILAIKYLAAAVNAQSVRSTTAAAAAPPQQGLGREAGDVDKSAAGVTVKCYPPPSESVMSAVVLFPQRQSLVPMMARVPPEVRAKVEDLCRQQPGVSMSEVIRVAIERLLADVAANEARQEPPHVTAA